MKHAKTLLPEETATGIMTKRIFQEYLVFRLFRGLPGHRNRDWEIFTFPFAPTGFLENK
jgi:hypothetical protein